MVSILLATYNGERYINKAIDSVLNQSFVDFELLIGFNGTTDRSKDKVSKYQDERIKIFDYADEKGKAKTLNKLIKEASFDFVCLQDDDDIWLNTKLEKQIPLMQSYDIVGSMIKYIDEYDNEKGKPILSITHEDIVNLSLRGINQVANTSAMFKKHDALQVNCWSDSLDGIEDYDFWLKLMRCGKRFTNIQEELVLHRVHSNSNFNTRQHDINKIL